MSENENNNAKKKELFSLIKDISYAFLVTNGNSGISTRPMAVAMSGDTFENDSIHFMTMADSKKIDEIKENSSVKVLLSDTSSNKYVSISGTAAFTFDMRQIKEHWDFINNAFFEQGLDTQGLCLLKVKIDSAEYWQIEKNLIKLSFNLGKGILLNEKANITEHKSLNIN